MERTPSSGRYRHRILRSIAPHYPDTRTSRHSRLDTYGIAAIIELARDEADNPQLPRDLSADYAAAWSRLVDIGLRELSVANDPTLVSGIMAVVAIGKGLRTLGRLAIEFTEDERLEMLKKIGWL